MTAETWQDADTGSPVEPPEEIKPKPRRARGSTKAATPPKQTEEWDLDSIPPNESYPLMEEPPVGVDDPALLATLESAVQIFSEDMSPAERARMESQIQSYQTDPRAGYTPRGRVSQPDKGLVEKLVEIMAAVDAVEKRGRNDAQKYSYQRSTDVFNAVRPEFISRGLLLTTHVLDKRITMFPSKSGGTNVLYDVDVMFRVMDGREVLEFTGAGAGIDTGDKGLYKAITGAMKYGIRQLLMLPDENDPEKPRPDELPEAGQQGGPIQITSSNVAGMQQGGRQAQATEAQLVAIVNYSNQLGLMPEALEAFIVSTVGDGPGIDPALGPGEAAVAIKAWIEAQPFDVAGKIAKGLYEATLTNGGS